MNYVADFETTTNEDDCRVWGWGLVAIPDDWQSLDLDSVAIGTDMDSFIDAIADSNTTCYFHNLRFDGRFVLDWLLHHGYELFTGTGHQLPGTFKSLINDNGEFYTITVCWGNGNHTEFRDSLKKLPMSVATIAKAFDMAAGKGEIDYELERPIGWRITPEEADYIRRDVWIVARALGQQLAQGMAKLTVGSDALYEFKGILGRNEFERLFPTFSLVMDSEIRKAYRGGWTYADPRTTGRLVGGGAVYDVNSLYPSVMHDELIPYGEPEWVPDDVEPTSRRPLTIFAVTFTAKIKPGHLPCIQIKGSNRFSATEYLSDVPEPTTLMFTNIDWALVNDHYDVDVLAWDGGWRFAAARGIFDPYIDKWTRIKAHSTGGMRALAKLQLNSLYGKFATNPVVSSKYPVLDEHGIVRLKSGPDEQRNPVYTPAGVFITSYARNVTIRAAQANYDAFAYADTDSLHLLTTSVPNGITVHPTELGAWKHEYDFTNAWYIRAKAYLEQTVDGRYHNAIAGVPTFMSGALTFEDLRPGTELVIDRDGTVTRNRVDVSNGVLLHGKLQPNAVPGGIVLRNVPFELKL